MKLLRFDLGKGARVGVVVDETVIDLQEIPGSSKRTMLDLLELGLEEAGRICQEATAALKESKTPPAWAHPLSSAKVLTPIPNPSKIIAVGLNYLDHCRETRTDPPESPVLFAKMGTSVAGPGDPIHWPNGLGSQVDPEVELAVVIGKKTRGISPDRALECVFGYTILNDVSARDIQFHDKQWIRGKSFDSFCPIGPVITTADEIPDPQDVRLSCAVSGRKWQDSSTKEMIFPVAYLLSFISQAITLLPGDIIATGTPHGVGMSQKPPVYLKAGDVVRLEIEKIGVLENPVKGSES